MATWNKNEKKASNENKLQVSKIAQMHTKKESKKSGKTTLPC